METNCKCALIYSLDGISQPCQTGMVLLGFCQLVTQAKTSKPSFLLLQGYQHFEPLTFIINEALLLFPGGAGGSMGDGGGEGARSRGGSWSSGGHGGSGDSGGHGGSWSSGGHGGSGSLGGLHGG